MTRQVVDLGAAAGGGGVVWSVSTEGFHTNLVVLDAGGSIGAHRNDALDVLVVVLDGRGTVTVDGDDLAVGPSTAVLVPRGETRAITAGHDGLRYLTVHGARGPLTVGSKSAP